MAANSEITLFVSQRQVKHKSVSIQYIPFTSTRSEDMSAWTIIYEIDETSMGMLHNFRCHKFKVDIFSIKVILIQAKKQIGDFSLFISIMKSLENYSLHEEWSMFIVVDFECAGSKKQTRIRKWISPFTWTFWEKTKIWNNYPEKVIQFNVLQLSDALSFP